MTFDSVIFDLDGTLWDTCGSCAIAWNNVVNRHSIEFREVTKEDVASVTGMPHDKCIRMVYDGLPDEQIKLIAQDTVHEDILMVEKYGGDIYPGVPEGLVKLASCLPLFIVSNCQSGYIETFLDWANYESLFQDFECWGNTGHPKSQNLADVIARNSLKRPVFIGDTKGDRKAAKDCNVPFVQVTYGFEAPIEGEQQVDSFSELYRYVTGPVSNVQSSNR